MGFFSCHWLLKLLLVIFNIIFGLCGIAGCVFSIWMLADPSYMLPEDSTDYKISVAIILIASILLVIVSFLGICGALRNSQCLLLTFFSILLIICVAEVAAILWGYINRDTLEEQIRNSVKLTVEQDYGKGDKNELFDTFQRKLHCCGAEKPSDWMGNNHVIMTVSARSDFYKIPESCCREHVSTKECRDSTHVQKVKGSIDYNVIYEKGCYTLILSKLKEYACIIIGVVGALILIQVLALIFSLILAYMFGKSNRYKA